MSAEPMSLHLEQDLSGVEKNEKSDDLTAFPFTDIYLTFPAAGLRSTTLVSRYRPQVISPDESRGEPVPDRFSGALDEIRKAILAQEDLRQGDEATFDGVSKRWWHGVITCEGMLLRYAVSHVACEEIMAVVRRVRTTIPTLESLNLPSRAVVALRRLISQSSGLVLISGSTGAGKTTTACALLSYFLQTMKAVGYTIEDPPEMLLHGEHGEGVCIQTDVEQNGGWASAVKKALRSSPDYLFIGEIIDANVAQAALRAATTGHLVISTIHAASPGETIDAFVRLVGGADSTSLRMQCAQQLTAVIHQTRVNSKVSMTMLDIYTPENKTNLRRLIVENRTNAIDSYWTESFEAGKVC